MTERFQEKSVSEQFVAFIDDHTRIPWTECREYLVPPMDVPYVLDCVESITFAVHGSTDAQSGRVSNTYSLLLETEKGPAKTLLHDPALGEFYLLIPYPPAETKLLEEGTIEFLEADVAELLEALRWSEQEQGMLELSPAEQVW